MIPNLVAQAAKSFKAALSKKGVDVVLTWSTVAGGTPDPTTGAVIGGTVTNQTETVKGFVNFDMAKTMIHHFQNYQEGDCVADLAPEVVIEGRENLTFTIDGIEYSQKEVGAEAGGKVAQQFEYQAGTKIYRTIYLKRLA
jgi:hypothetical protein